MSVGMRLYGVELVLKKTGMAWATAVALEDAVYIMVSVLPRVTRLLTSDT